MKGELVPDPRRRLPGRGAWLHPSTTCFEQAVRRKAFTRALRLQAGPDVARVADHLTSVQQDEKEWLAEAEALRQASADVAATIAAARPSAPSASGLIWPLSGTITSPSRSDISIDVTPAPWRLCIDRMYMRSA